MDRDLSRLLRPKSIAVVGGGAWCRAAIHQCQKIGFEGAVFPVHPKADEIGGVAAFARVEDLPHPPDACFIGVNRHSTIEIVRALAGLGAGGAVCFASGFLEAKGEDAAAADLQARLLEAAGEMPILGPNCYGFINYLDGTLLWPDQHGGVAVEKGVALITQSSNIAINLTMQARGLPLAYVVTVGNQAQTGLAEIGQAVLGDDRVTALGLHIEGIGDIRAFEALAVTAHRLGKPIVALKVGKSVQAQVAAVSHTASLAGHDAGAAAFLTRLGVVRVDDLAVFLETLKLMHVAGRLGQNTLATISCSGGEASLAADIGHDFDVAFPALNDRQKAGLTEALGPMVSLANPLDYHTYIWRDVAAMTAAFKAVVDPGIAITLLIVDFPRSDRCDPSDWDCVIEAAIVVKAATGANIGMVSSLPETMPEDVAARLLEAGVVPLSGLREAIAAVEAGGRSHRWCGLPVCLPSPTVVPDLMTEAGAKADLAGFGVVVPSSIKAASPVEAGRAAEKIGGLVALKAEGVAHKSEAQAVALNLAADQVTKAAARMGAASFLVEEMIQGGVAELLVGVVKDPAHGFVMTVGAGGVLTELLGDTASFLLPATDEMIDQALGGLKIASVLAGYRGAQAAHMPSIVQALRAVEAYVLENAIGLEEIEVNPLICTPDRAVAADALIRKKD